MFEIENTNIQGLKIITPKIFDDSRGLFCELYQKSLFEKININDKFVQTNLSISKYKTLRGLHYQLNPKAQSKLVSCISGEILDVAVDLRKNSPTFSQYFALKLSEHNKKLLYIPQGFAHGFVTLSDQATFLYQVGHNEYSKNHEAAIIWNDTSLNINWNINFKPILSLKDSMNPSFDNCLNNFS